jgi:hypothetical protein
MRCDEGPAISADLSGSGRQDSLGMTTQAFVFDWLATASAAFFAASGSPR